MRIPCPFCGERDLREFAIQGDASYLHPEPGCPDLQEKYVDAVYVRDNTAGRHQELWYHASGCRTWLIVTRDTRTHEIFSVEYPHRSLDV